jgi:hypothetical protein
MKKLHITIVLFLWCFAQVAEAQNMYRNYLSSYVTKPESAVSVVHSNGYVYYFQSQRGYLSVSEQDSYYLNPTGNDNAFDLTQNATIPDFILQGGFEDFNGDFFLFGYDKSFNDCPAFGIVSADLQTFQYFYLNTTGNNKVSFTQGCWGKDYQHATFYMLVRSDGQLCAIDPANFLNLSLISPGPEKRYTDILWDEMHNCFVAAGSNCNGATCLMAPFLQVFTYDLSAQVFVTEFSYKVTIPVNGLEEGKALHAITDQEQLILYQDLSYLDYDFIWLTRINDYWNNNYVVDQSNFFVIPVGKLHAIDMVYNQYHDQLNFLGELNLCTELTTILAQVDATALSGMKIGQLDGGMAVSSCWDALPSLSGYPPSQYIYGSNLTMRNLAVNVNSSCVPVLVSGTNGTTHSVLSEVIDIKLSLCDKSLISTELPAIPVQSNDYVYYSYLPDSCQFPVIYQVNETVSQYFICLDPYSCSKQTKEDTLKSKNRDYSTASQKVILEDYGVFVCEGFEGDIQCALFDMAGKLIQQCITVNGKRNMIDNTTGFYLLKATDAIGNWVVKKVFIP